MLEIVISKNPPWDGNITGPTVTNSVAANFLSSTLFQIPKGDGTYDLYLFGGRNPSYVATNALYLATTSWVMVGDSTGSKEFTIDSTVISFCKSFVIGTKVYIFGVSTSGYYACKIIDFVTKTSITHVSSLIANINSFCNQLGVDYDELTGIFYMKQIGIGLAVRFHIATNTFTSFINSATLNNGEFVVVDSSDVYFLGGWGGSTHNTKVYKVSKASPTEVLEHDTIDPKYGSINQGYVKKRGGVIYYPTYFSNFYLTAYDVPNKKITQKAMSVTYRNVICLGEIAQGMIIAGGTSIAVGSTNWTTNSRVNEAKIISFS